MSVKALEKLRESSHLDDDKWTLDSGEVVHVYGSDMGYPDAVNWGEQWRKIADEIEAEISERYMELPCDGDGEIIHIGDRLIWVKHVRTPLTVEEVLADFAADVERNRNTPETANRYADEIRSILGGGR